MAAARAIVATLGSVGDVLPMLAIATALRQRGVQVIVATSPRYRQIVVNTGHAFTPIGGDEDPTVGATLLADATIDFIDRANFTQLDALFDDLLAAAAAADVIVAPHHVVPAHLIAEKLDIPYVACAFSPAHLLVGAPSRAAGIARIKTPAHWHAELSALRRRRGLPRSLLPYSAVFNRAACLLGLFPRFLLAADASTIPGLEVTGYPVPPRADASLASSIGEHCDDDTVVFSFGSYADRLQPERLFAESIAACRSLGLKCLYLSRYLPAAARKQSAAIRVHPFAPHDEVFASVGIVVHHGGLGTLMAACRHARPMVIVPFFYDQPYHAHRMSELIGAPSIPAALYEHHNLAAALTEVLANRDQLRARTRRLMAEESDGAQAAAERICALILQPPRR